VGQSGFLAQQPPDIRLENERHTPITARIRNLLRPAIMLMVVSGLCEARPESNFAGVGNSADESADATPKKLRLPKSAMRIEYLFNLY
jgi:hypothetical protein